MDASRLLLPFAASALLLTSLCAPAAGADDPTCRGLTATIVGEPAEPGQPAGTIQGTDGDDVVVTNGITFTQTFGGDDTVCVTGQQVVEYVDVGDGDDIVDTSTMDGRSLITLGAGADTFVGGTHQDSVATGEVFIDDPFTHTTFTDEDVDHVTTGPGYDRVTTGQAGRDNHDDVDLGPDTDALVLVSGRNDGALDGDTGLNHVEVALDRAGRWDVDDAADELRLDDAVVTRWTDIDVTGIEGDASTRVRYVGTPANDKVDVEARVDGADLGAGDDRLRMTLAGPPSGALAAGPGRDLLTVFTDGSAVLDLPRQRFSGSQTGVGARVTGFETYAVSGRAVRMTGSSRADDLTFTACTAIVHGLGGADLLQYGGGSTCNPDRTRYRVFGGPGDDKIVGSIFRDHLDGGRGTDVVYARAGVDWCRGEVLRGCERP